MYLYVCIHIEYSLQTLEFEIRYEGKKSIFSRRLRSVKTQRIAGNDVENIYVKNLWLFYGFVHLLTIPPPRTKPVTSWNFFAI